MPENIAFTVLYKKMTDLSLRMFAPEPRTMLKRTSLSETRNEFFLIFITVTTQIKLQQKLN
jgi:hypothetical protein